MKFKKYTILIVTMVLSALSSTRAQELEKESQDKPQVVISENLKTHVDLIQENGQIIQFDMPSKYMSEHEHYANVYGMELAAINERLEKLRQHALSNLLSSEYKKVDIVSDGVFNITHKIWLTNPDNPFPVRKDILQKLKQTYLDLKGYKHIFWSNYPIILSEDFKALATEGINVEVKHTDELKNMPGRRLFEVFIKHRLFANASDIIRLQVLYAFGGIYSDVGWTINQNIATVIGNFDYVTNEFLGVCANHSFMFMKKDNNICKSMLEKLDDYKFMKPYLYSGYDLGHIRETTELVCPKMLTTAIATLSASDTKLLILYSGDHTYKNMHLNSWHKNSDMVSRFLSTLASYGELLITKLGFSSIDSYSNWLFTVIYFFKSDKFGSSTPVECNIKQFIKDYE